MATVRSVLLKPLFSCVTLMRRLLSVNCFILKNINQPSTANAGSGVVIVYTHDIFTPHASLFETSKGENSELVVIYQGRQNSFSTEGTQVVLLVQVIVGDALSLWRTWQDNKWMDECELYGKSKSPEPPESEKSRQRVSNADQNIFANPKSFCDMFIIGWRLSR